MADLLPDVGSIGPVRHKRSLISDMSRRLRAGTPRRPRTDSTDGGDTGSGSPYVIIGRTSAAERVATELTLRGTGAVHLPAPTDTDLAVALGPGTRWVAILEHDDIRALHHALACAHRAPDASILVTIFDRTIGDELKRLVPHCEVTSPADLAVPHLTRMCIGDTTLDTESGRGRGFLRAITRGAATAATHLSGFARTTDVGSRMMLLGLVGLAAIVVVDLMWLVLAEHRTVPTALHEAVRVVTTVGPAEDPHGSAYAVLAALSMFVTVIVTAVFTAGIVDRSIGPRLLGLLGPRSLPRSGHVIVVGLGQVGARLCIQLRELGIPVLAVERDHDAPGLRIIHDLRIPTIVGHGIDRALLQKARLSKAAAIAAVGSSDLDNLAVAVSAHGITDRPRIVLRAGEHDTAAGTRALLPLGAVCDVTALAADHVVRRLSPCGTVPA
ncbi:potassium channel family protein [Gordonia sp. NPDC003376]